MGAIMVLQSEQFPFILYGCWVSMTGLPQLTGTALGHWRNAVELQCGVVLITQILHSLHQISETSISCLDSAGRFGRPCDVPSQN